jgi:hypothetical protein
MSEKTAEGLLYECEAKAVIGADPYLQLYFTSFVPYASEEQLAAFQKIVTSLFRAGIILGLDISGTDPIGEIE